MIYLRNEMQLDVKQQTKDPEQWVDRISYSGEPHSGLCLILQCQSAPSTHGAHTWPEKSPVKHTSTGCAGS